MFSLELVSLEQRFLSNVLPSHLPLLTGKHPSTRGDQHGCAIPIATVRTTSSVTRSVPDEEKPGAIMVARSNVCQVQLPLAPCIRNDAGRQSVSHAGLDGCRILRHSSRLSWRPPTSPNAVSGPHSSPLTLRSLPRSVFSTGLEKRQGGQDQADNGGQDGPYYTPLSPPHVEKLDEAEARGASSPLEPGPVGLAETAPCGHAPPGERSWLPVLDRHPPTKRFRWPSALNSKGPVPAPVEGVENRIYASAAW